MAKIKHTTDGWRFECPGCGSMHVVTRDGWLYNNNPDRPTFHPSINIQVGMIVCHSSVRDGFITFLNDCTHPLVNKTVMLPELESCE